MSYIRSGSNPENLYIWDNGETVYVSAGSSSTLEIPSGVWISFLRYCVDFVKGYDNVLNYKGMLLDLSGAKAILYYHKWDENVEMHYSTWYYLLHSNAHRWKKE